MICANSGCLVDTTARTALRALCRVRETALTRRRHWVRLVGMANLLHHSEKLSASFHTAFGGIWRVNGGLDQFVAGAGKGRNGGLFIFFLNQHVIGIESRNRENRNAGL